MRPLPPAIRKDIPNAQLPAVYKQACNALAECERLDECKDWSDKAAALASYARQAKNPELEQHAKRIRLRAMHRVGELLLAIESHSGVNIGRKVTLGLGRRASAAAAGLSLSAANAATRLALVAPQVREAFIERAETTAPSAVQRLLPPVVFTQQGRVSEHYRELMVCTGGLASTRGMVRRHPPAETARQFTPDEADRIRPYLVEFAEWVDEFERRLPKKKAA